MIQITIQISGDTLTDVERGVLAALAGSTAAQVTVEAPAFIEAGEQEAYEEAKPKRHRRTKAEMEADRAAEEAPEPEPEPTPEPEPVAPEPEVEPTLTAVPGGSLDEAVKIATKMVSDGRVADIKAFLTKLGVKRVSELRGDQIAAFTAEFAA